MPPTRKRKASQSLDTDDQSSSNVLVIKRNRLMVKSQLSVCREIYSTIRNERLEDGSLLCEPFLRVPKRKAEPEYYDAVTTPMDLSMIQQKLKNEEYDDVEQMSADIRLIVTNATAVYGSDSAEYQQADALWELFLELKTTVNEDVGPAVDDDDEDDDNSRMSSVTDDTASRDEGHSDIQVTGVGPKVPVLKLKVGAGGYVEGSAVVDDDTADTLNTTTQSNDCSSDFDGASENQSISTMHSRLSSSSELDDQASSEATMGLRERRYAYRDFITPKQTRKKNQDVASSPREQRAETPASATEEQLESAFEQLFTAIVTATDGDRVLCQPFKVLPCRTKYVDYYQVIREPIDLRTIAQKIQSSAYQILDDMHKDLMLMIQNAKFFNKPSSLIYKDAVALRKILSARKNELEQVTKPGMQATPLSRIHRVRTRCSTAGAAVSGQSLVADFAALPDEPDDEKKTTAEPDDKADSEPPTVSSCAETVEQTSDADGSESSEETSDLWTLLKTVRNYTTNLGLCLAEPFLRLPSKRTYADYYQEIKKPISMTKIQKKLKNNRYGDLDALASDLNLLFDNAKQYNREESKIYKDAVKLQTIMTLKKDELKRAKESLEVASTQSQVTTPETSVASSEDVGHKKKRSRSVSSDDSLKKRLMLIFNFINDYQFDGRRLIDIFVTVPSKKDHPNYYKVISEPIDMTTIESKIKTDKYSSQQALVDDIELMFKNARHYNEEKSQVYKDADTLEHQLHSRVRTLAPIDDQSKNQPRSAGRPKSKAATTLAGKLQELYNAVRDYTDSHGRTLSTPYMKLPPKSEYPDYYEVIRRPIDMQKVLQRMTALQYQCVDDMVADFVLMFGNACKYNEPESLIYKDALTLQRVCLSKKAELVDDSDDALPDVPALVQELMLNVFVSTFSHADEEGRCFSDSFLELPASVPVDDSEDSKKAARVPGNFEQIKRNLDKGRYKRFDRFQDDMFDVFEYARKVSSIDSQVYEDSVELQSYFIQQRDELCRRGEVLLTPALNFTSQQFAEMIEDDRREQTSREQDDDERRKQTAAVKATSAQETSVESCEYNGVVYRVGDFVYVEQRDKEKGTAPHIVSCERLTIDEDGDQCLYGCWFLRPNETFHLATRKFLQKEVFKSDFYDTAPFHKVLGKCCVLFVKEYFRCKPEGFADEDVFVCESRYSGKSKSFKKIKAWQPAKSDHVCLITRSEPLNPVRVASVFAEKTDCGVLSADDGMTDVLDKSREVVLVDDVSLNDGFTYYEQFRVAAGWIKLGDAVYLNAAGEEHPRIIHIDKLWTNSTGESFIHGPFFVHPAQIDHVPTRLFYKKEVIRSSKEETVPSSSIVGRCAVLSYKEYCTSRFTEIPENDVFVCESKCDGTDKVIKKFGKPLKRISLSDAVCEDEVYFFKKQFVPHKELSPLLPKALDMSVADEESMDCPSSVDQSFNDTCSYQGDSVAENTPTSSKKKKVALKDKAANKVRQISGYIVFAAECRKDIQAEYPGSNFGEISRIVGNKWKALPREVKDHYEERARQIAIDSAAKKISETSTPEMFAHGSESRSMSPYSNSHFLTSGVNGMFSPQHCMPPLYALNSPYQPVGPGFAPAQYNMQPVCFANGFQGGQQQIGGATAAMKPMLPPLFVSVPPRTQKVVHSDAYLRYIEGLTSGSRSVGGWEKSLYAKPPENPAATPVSDKLPVDWLADGNQENAVSALWALRDHMLKDALTISRTLDSTQI